MVLQVGSHQHKTEGQDHLLCPADHAALYAAQDMVGSPGCEGTLLARALFSIHQYPQILFVRAMLYPYIPQLVLIARLATTQVQDLVLTVCMRSIQNSVKNTVCTSSISKDFEIHFHSECSLHLYLLFLNNISGSSPTNKIVRWYHF